MKYLITICVLALGWVPGTFAAVIYVDVDATGNNDGSSWENAYDNITNALNVATDGDELWVARGTYYPTDTDNPNLVFWMPCGVSMYGGFQGNETARIERNWNVNPTILSGEIGDENDLTDNSNGMMRWISAATNTAFQQSCTSMQMLPE